MQYAPRPAAFHWLALAAGLALSSHAAELPKGATPVLSALRTELDRSLAAFRAQPTPAYFLSYTVTESHSFEIDTAFGALMKSNEERARFFDLDLRVGSARLDNTHVLRGDSTSAVSTSTTLLSVDDDPAAIRATVWYQTDLRYKSAVEQLTKVKSNVAVMVADEDKSADFAAAPAVVFVQPAGDVRLDRDAWEQKLRRYTAPFAAHGDIYAATANLAVQAQTRWYVNSEGTLLQIAQTTARLIIDASTKADDGMALPLHETFLAFAPDQLPGDAEVLARVERMIANLAALRTAPVIDPYTGPAILSGRAAGVFFHEVFGHRVEGHRQKNAAEGQTFKKMLGQRLLPETFGVYSDPTLETFAATPLGGYYLYDDEGVKARRVPLVEAGVFKGFLMARMPIEGFPESNGHGRKAIGETVVSRQSNLIVEATKTVSRATLKQELLRLVAEQKKPYGLFFDDIEGGFAITGRAMPNAFNVNPVLVYRIYPDGREELVRGADFIGTPLAAFSKIVAADDSPGIFNGICGAESGWIPVSAVSPGLLLSQVEVQKKEKSQERLPLLSAPLP
jgi:TldD protein